MSSNFYFIKIVLTITIIFIFLTAAFFLTFVKNKDTLVDVRLFWNKTNKSKENYKDIIIKKRSILTDPRFKWTFPIKYEIEDKLHYYEIIKAIKDIESKTCIIFKKVDKVVGEGIKYINGHHCLSVVGKSKISKPQNITIGEHCDEIGGIQHETAHALGVFHEMSRKDRDKYIKILKQNILPKFYTNFKIFDKIETKTYGIMFNYGSSLLYDRFAGSKNHKPTTEAKKPYYSKTMGQSKELAFTDIKLLNMYYCDEICKTKLDCKNNGYTNPRNCSVCQCPRFFKGQFCGEIWTSSSKCGKLILNATSKDQIIRVNGKKKCLYKIISQADKKIKLHINYAHLAKEKDYCQHNTGLEIKYQDDKSVSGAMFCGVYKNAALKSDGNFVLLYYVGLKKFHKLILKFKSI